MLLAVLLGVVNAFDLPARQAALVQMVDREDLMNAIALNSSMFNGARIVGPAVAGILVAAIGEGWCFFANAVSYIAVLAGLLIMRMSGARDGRAVRGTAVANIIEGFRYVARTRPIRALLILIGVVSFAGMPYAVLMPVFAQQILHSGARGLGTLMGCSGAGALVGSIALAMRSSVKGLGKWVAISAGMFGAALAAFALSKSFLLSAILLVPVGGAMMVQMASSNTLIQSMVPDELRGRVMSVYSMMFMGMGPLGSLLAGSAAQRVGAPAAVAAGGVLTIIAAVIFALRLPNLRGEATRLIVAQQFAGGDPAEEQTATGAET